MVTWVQTPSVDQSPLFWFSEPEAGSGAGSGDGGGGGGDIQVHICVMSRKSPHIPTPPIYQKYLE